MLFLRLDTIIELIEDWTFEVENERRNSSLCELIGIPYQFQTYGVPFKKFTITFPAGTHLKIDRIHLRRGCQDYDSVTFSTDGKPGYPTIQTTKKPKRHRFWVKLAEANKIQAIIIKF